jgi:T-complex protein 1 subunit theta
MNKMVVNHLDKLFVTSDASTIINEMEVQHPAAKLVVFASQAQEQEIGDGSNFVSTCQFLHVAKPSRVLGDGCCHVCAAWYHTGRRHLPPPAACR